MKAGFDSFKSFFPSFYESSKKSIGNMVSSLTMTESEYLYKTESTEKEIVQYLISKMEMEIILGLKIIISNIQSDKDISAFMPRIVEIFLVTKDYYTKRLCLNIIDHLTLQKRSEMLLFYNVITKLNNDPDAMNRLSLLHMIASLKSQEIAGECSKQLIPFTSDSNPLLRRMAMIVIVNYIKVNGDNTQITHEEFDSILKKYLADPHPMVSSAFFYAISELGNSDYFSLMLHNYFEVICDTLAKYDEYYYDRAVYSMMNFTKTVLVHNIENNMKYIMKLYQSLYYITKHTTDPGRLLCTLYGIYELIYELSLHSNKTISEKLFKSNKQLKKIAKVLIQVMLQNEHCSTIHYLTLSLIKKYIQSAKSTLNDIYFSIIKRELCNYLNYFYIKYFDIKNEFIPFIKLDIIAELTTELNIKSIIDELKRTLHYPNPKLKKRSIKILELICNSAKGNEQIVPLCIETMIEMLKIKDEMIINQVILSLSQLISEVKEQKKYVLIYSIKNFKKSISSPCAKANIIWMISNCIESIPTVIIDFYRRLLLDIDKEVKEIKLQLIGLSYKIHDRIDWIVDQYEEGVKTEIKTKIQLMIKYLIEKMLFDNDYLIREKARAVNAFIESGVKLVTNYNETTSIKEGNKEEATKSIRHLNEHQFFLSLSHLQHGLDKASFKFTYDNIDSALAEKMKSISLDELIQATSTKEQLQTIQNTIATSPNTQLASQNKYTSCSNEMNVGNEVSNFNAGLNIEEKKQSLKNQLDEFLNGNDDDDEDEVVIEIKHNNP